MSNANYSTKFDEYHMRCGVTEDKLVALTRFKMGLRLEIQKELIPHQVTSLDHAYQLVQELERCETTI